MNRARLLTLAARLDQLDGPGTPGTNRHRRNEPGPVPSRNSRRDGEYTFQQEKELSRLSEAAPHTLNLNLKIRDDNDGGIGNVALVVTTLFRGLAKMTFPRHRTTGPHESTLEASAAELLGIDADTARVLFHGPNWIGGARAWVRPDEAELAVRALAHGTPLAEIWSHLDRAALCAAHGGEDIAAHPKVLEYARARAEACTRGQGQRLSTDERLTYVSGWLDAARDSHRGEHIDIGVQIHPSTQVAPTAIIGSDVYIGAKCRIEAYSKICHGVRVGDNTTVYAASRIGHGSVIGVNCRIAGQTGAYARIGNNVTTESNELGSCGPSASPG